MLDPLLCVGIHAGDARKMEYGTAGRPDYQGWGQSAEAYSRFVLEELHPGDPDADLGSGLSRKRHLRVFRWGR